MKRIVALSMALLLCLSLCACNTQSSSLSKEELLDQAIPFEQESIEKCQNNLAFAESLAGNVYTFVCRIKYIDKEYAEVDVGSYANLVSYVNGKVYLTAEELCSVEENQLITVVGRLDEVGSTEKAGENGTEEELIFKSAAIKTDRFEETGVVDGFSALGIDTNTWVICNEYGTNLKVSFREGVEFERGEVITFSYKHIGGYVDAYPVE